MADQNEYLTDFEEGARQGLEWLSSSQDGAELATIVGQMPTKLGDMETAFLIAIGRAALAGHKAMPQPEGEAKARPDVLSMANGDRGASPAEFWRRYRDYERQARMEELLRANSAEAAVYMPGGDGWRGW